jgi:hypothetical protein
MADSGSGCRRRDGAVSSGGEIGTAGKDAQEEHMTDKVHDGREDVEAVDAARMRAAQRTAATATEEDSSGSAVAESPPGCLSITQGESSQVGEKGRAVGSEDWFECAICVKWKPGAIESLSQRLEFEKARCQQSHGNENWIDLPGLASLKVGRTGKSKGGGRGAHFEFHLGYRGIEFLLSSRREYCDTLPNAWLTLTGRHCLLVGSFAGLAAFREIVSLLGGETVSEKLSRVDLTLDIAGLPVRAFHDVYAQDWFVSTARRDSVYRDGGNVTGFTRGQSPCRVTFYDKLREVQEGVDTNISDVMIRDRWGGQLPDSASRIEFSLRRQWLRDLSVNTTSEYFAARGVIVQKLTGDFFRLTDSAVDRKNNHQSRAATHPLWDEVQQAFAKWAGRPSGTLVRPPDELSEPIKLLKQGLGCFKKAALISGVELVSLKDAELFAMQALEKALPTEAERQLWLETYRRESTEYPAFRKERAA